MYKEREINLIKVKASRFDLPWEREIKRGQDKKCLFLIDINLAIVLLKPADLLSIHYTAQLYLKWRKTVTSKQEGTCPQCQGQYVSIRHRPSGTLEGKCCIGGVGCPWFPHLRRPDNVSSESDGWALRAAEAAGSWRGGGDSMEREALGAVCPHIPLTCRAEQRGETPALSKAKVRAPNLLALLIFSWTQFLLSNLFI